MGFRREPGKSASGFFLFPKMSTKCYRYFENRKCVCVGGGGRGRGCLLRVSDFDTWFSKDCPLLCEWPEHPRFLLSYEWI